MNKGFKYNVRIQHMKHLNHDAWWIIIQDLNKPIPIDEVMSIVFPPLTHGDALAVQDFLIQRLVKRDKRREVAGIIKIIEKEKKKKRGLKSGKKS